MEMEMVINNETNEYYIRVVPKIETQLNKFEDLIRKKLYHEISVFQNEEDNKNVKVIVDETDRNKSQMKFIYMVTEMLNDFREKQLNAVRYAEKPKCRICDVYLPLKMNNQINRKFCCGFEGDYYHKKCFDKEKILMNK